MEARNYNSLAYYGPEPPLNLGNGYVIGLERLKDIILEIKPLHDEQVKVTEAHWMSFPIEYDYMMYLVAAENNKLIVMTLRHEGELVGNLMYTIKPAGNFKGAIGAYDAGLFIYPEHRGGRRADKLMEYGESVLKAIGIHFIIHGDKGPCGGVDLHGFFKRKGYKPYSTEYVKEIGKLEPKT